MAIEYTDQNPDISYETSYDLPGEDMFGIEMAHKFRAHTPHGKRFMDFLLKAKKAGGRYYGIGFDGSYYQKHPPTLKTPHHLHFTLKVAERWSDDFGTLRLHESIDISQPSRYQDMMEKHLGFRTYPDIEPPGKN